MGGSSGPSTMSTLTPAQQKIASQLSDYLGGQIGQKSPQYRGADGKTQPIVAPLNTALGTNANQINNFNPSAGANQGLNAIQGLLAGGNIHSTLTAADTQNYIQKGIYDPANLNFQRTTLPQINQAFAGQGASFSSRAGTAVSRASSDLNTQLAGQAANVTMQNEQVRSQQDLTAQQANAQNTMQSAGLAANMTTSALQNLLAQNGANWNYQNYANQGSQAQYQDFLRQLPGNNPALGQALGLVNTQQLSAYNKPASPLSSILGFVGGAVGSAFLPGIGTALGAGLGGMLGGSGGSMVGQLPSPNFG